MTISQKNNTELVKKYRIEGLNVIPIKEGDKKPPISSWKEYQSKKYEEKIPPLANIAVICGEISGNLVVVDVDKSDLKLVNEIYPNALKETRVVKTGSGGYHLYFFHVNKLTQRPLRLNKANGDHIDVQANGTYVVAPPSIHENGHEYKIISDTDKIKTIDFQNVVTNLGKAGFKVKQKATINKLVKGGIKTGNRHNSALRYANLLLGRLGFDTETLRYEMKLWNQTLNPPLPEDELDRIVSDCIKFCEGEGQTSLQLKKEGSPESIHVKLADAIMERRHFRTLRETEEILVYEHGVYNLYGKPKIKEECELMIDKCYNSLVSEVIGTIQRRTYIRREEFDNLLYLLNLQNGILNIETNQLRPHNPKHLFRVQLPVEYNPNAVPVKIMKFFKDILPPEHIQWVLDMIAYCLVKNCKQEKAMMLVGLGGNGKSTLLNLIIKFLGKENVANHSTYELQNDRFAKADLDGKLANIHPDIESDEIERTGVLKMLISGDRITVQQKNRDPYSMESFAKLIFSTNQMPDVTEEPEAFFQRWIIIDFNKVFRGTKNENKNLIDEITSDEELSGLLNVVMRRMPKLFSKNPTIFKNAPSGDELKKTWREHANSVESFGNNEIIIEKGAKLRKSHTYEIYQMFCKNKKFKILSQLTFSRKFKESFGDKIEDVITKDKNGKSVRVWGNAKLRNPPKPSPDDPQRGIDNFNKTPV